MLRIAQAKMVIFLYFSRKSSDVDDIWCTDANFDSQDGHVIKTKKFRNTRWWLTDLNVLPHIFRQRAVLLYLLYKNRRMLAFAL